MPRISVDHTNGMASTQHLSDIPKPNARPGMARYPPGVTEGPRLHQSSSISSRVPVKTCSLGIYFDFSFCSSICNELFRFAHLFDPPTGSYGEGFNSPALLHTSTFPPCPPLMHMSYSSLQKSIFNYTLLFLTFLYFQYTSCYAARESLACRKVLWERTPNPAPCLPPTFSHHLALGTRLIRANISPAESQKVPLFLLTVEQD